MSLRGLGFLTWNLDCSVHRIHSVRSFAKACLVLLIRGAHTFRGLLTGMVRPRNDDDLVLWALGYLGVMTVCCVGIAVVVGTSAALVAAWQARQERRARSTHAATN